MNLLLQRVVSIISAFFLGTSIRTLFTPQSALWKKLVFYYLLYITFALPCWVGDENPLYLFPFFIAAFFICFPDNMLKKLVMGGIFYTFLISFNMIIDSVSYDFHFKKSTILFKFGCWCLLSFCLTRLGKKGAIQLSKRLFSLLLGLTLAPLSAILSFSFWGYAFIDTAQLTFNYDTLKGLGFGILPFTLVSGFSLLLASMILSRHEALEQENQLGALREVYYTGLKQEHMQLRTLRHDLKNHILTLQGLLEQGNHLELAHYLAKLSDSPALSGGKRYTENEVVNVVLCSKAAQMECLHLTPDFTVMLPKTLSIPAPELCSLFGNALDNAIEGTKNAQNNVITLQARLEKGIFMLRVYNPIGTPIRSDFATTKPSPAEHGYGLSGMRAIAGKYGGSLEAANLNGYFELLICFPYQPKAGSE